MTAYTFSTQLLFKGVSILIRPMMEADFETLRIWKNENRKYFFHQKEISQSEQVAWGKTFLQNKFSEIFVAQQEDGEEKEDKGKNIYACVGFKWEEGSHRLELFNLICGSNKFLRTGFTAKFYEAVEARLKELGAEEIYLKVLKTNTQAIPWYLRQGFAESQPNESSDSDFLLLRKKLV
jgi:ribosomal protein S18 acetylase RimI-like enzyme